MSGLFTSPSVGYMSLVLLNLGLVLFLLITKPRNVERRAIMGIASLSVLCLVVTLGSHTLIRLGLAAGVYYVRELSTLVQGVCTLRLGGVVLFDSLLPAFRLSTSRLLHDLVVATLTFAWFGLWTHQHNIDLSSLIAPSAVVTAVLGLSLQDTLGNVIGGIALHLEESIQPGDWIKVDDMVGRVAELRWRYTALETRNWETVIIPNSTLLKQRFYVLGRRQNQPVQLRRWIWFNVDFRFSPNLVIDTVLEAMNRTSVPNVAAAPPPTCVAMELSDSYCRYAVRYHLTELAVDDPTDSTVRCHVFSALKRAGINLSMPAHAIFMTEDTDERKLRKLERTIKERLAMLRHVKLFSTCSTEELQELAMRLVPAPFVEGDIITRQGAEAHWLYIIGAGSVDVLVESHDGVSRKIGEVGANGYFGEMGLLTGSPRAATAVARGAVDCYRLEKDAFEKLLRNRPQLAQEISAMIAQRAADLESQTQQLEREAHGRISPESSDSILGRIRHFFRLDE
jgi:small-conductance mechanosensitive channel/CRP-like cAMP-binding protein